MKATLSETWDRFRCDFVAVLDGYQFLEIAGDRKAYLGDFGPRRGWLKHKSSEGLVKGRNKGGDFHPRVSKSSGGWLKGEDIRLRVSESSEGLVKGRRSMPRVSKSSEGLVKGTSPTSF